MGTAKRMRIVFSPACSLSLGSSKCPFSRFNISAAPFTDALSSWPSRKSRSTGSSVFSLKRTSSSPEVVAAFGTNTNARRYLTLEICAARCLASSRGIPRGASAKLEEKALKMINEAGIMRIGISEVEYSLA